MNEVLAPLLLAAAGAFMCVYGLSAAHRELRTGTAKGRFGVYCRSTQPARFWSIISIDFAAAAVGGAVLIVALVRLVGSNHVI